MKIIFLLHTIRVVSDISSFSFLRLLCIKIYFDNSYRSLPGFVFALLMREKVIKRMESVIDGSPSTK